MLKALQKDRQLRYQTAADMRADLQRQQRSTDQNVGALSAIASPTQMAARAAYDDFLSLWKNADADAPVLVQALAELAKLK